MSADPFRVPRIKVCGVRIRADLPDPLPPALEAVGFVSWSRSPRSVTAAEAAGVIARLPRHVLPVLVTVDAEPEAARAWMASSGARAIQLCGRERPASWRDFPHPILRRIAVCEGADEELSAWNGLARAFVLDHPSDAGGTGRTVDVERAREIAARVPCLLAGGLAADSVADLVAAVRPRGVDASSRLEAEPGRKDPARVGAFVRAAHAALTAIEEQEGRT